MNLNAWYIIARCFTMRSCAVVALAAVLAGITACTSYQQMDDFNSARERIRSGKSAQVIRDILGNWDKIPPGLHGEAIDTLAEVPGPDGYNALLAVFNKPGISKESQQRVLAQLVRRDDPGVPEFAFDLVNKDPDFLTDNVIAYFGKKKVTKAVPLLAKTAAGGRVDSPMSALREMGGPEAEGAILEAAAKVDHPARQRALEALPGVKDPGSQDKKAEVIRAIIKPGTKEPEAVVSAAVTAAGTLPYKQETYGALEEYYRTSQKPEMKNQARSSMSQMAGLDAYFVEREAVMRLADVQSSLAVMHASLKPASAPRVPTSNARSVPQGADPGAAKVDNKSPKPDAKPEGKQTDTKRRDQDQRKPEPPEKEIRTTRTPRVYDANYSARLSDVLMESMPEEDVQALRNRVNNVLLSYSDVTSGGTADFMVRAFRKEFRIGEKDARAAMAKGLRYPGSLTAVIRNVIEEYDGDDMRIYALATLFSVPRWQAALLLDLVKSGKL